MTRDPRKVQQIEVGTGIGGLILGTVSRFGGPTLRDVGLVGFGWAAGCAFHLGQMSLVSYLHREEPPS
ncbi:MAG: hypothetical protein ACYC91_15645 [Solirubrobacteraceae bacterium]